MDPETCDMYEKKKKMDNKNIICVHFTGDKDNRKQLDYCHRYCSYYESKRLMQDDIQPLHRNHGAMKASRGREK